MTTGERILSELDALTPHHVAMQSLWRECARLCSPVEVASTAAADKAAPKLIRQVSAHAILAAQRLTTDLLENIMPAAQMWFRFKPIRQMRDRRALAHWLGESSEGAFELMQQSNFQTEMQALFNARHNSGTATVRVTMLTREELLTNEDEDLENGLAFEVIPTMDVVISEDRRRRVAKWYITQKLTAEKALAEFGDECPEAIAAEARDPRRSQNEHEFVQAIYKRKASERREGTAQQRMPWASCWVHKTSKKVVKESGYSYQPVFTTRWERWNPRSPYGISPAMIALAEVRGLNIYEELLSTLAEVTVDPRIQVPVEHDGPVDLGPGGVTKVLNAESAPKEWAPAGRLDWGMEMLDAKKKTISDIFLNGVFAPLTAIERQITMYEASQRIRENLGRALPATQMLTSDLIDPLLESVLLWALENGRLDAPPEEAFVATASGQPKFVFPAVAQTNRLAMLQQAQTEGQLAGIMGTLAPLSQVAGPAVWDWLKVDEIGRTLAEEANLKTSLIRTPDEAAQVAAQREQAMLQQQALELAQRQPELAAAAAAAGGVQ
jgi:hypothetical protein